MRHRINAIRATSRLPIFFLAVQIVFLSAPLHAETDIGNGKLFVCDGAQILSTKSREVVAAKKARKRFRRIIQKQKAIIDSSSAGSRKKRRAKKKRKAARHGLRDVAPCANGSLTLSGSWNLLTENGKTPTENSYNSMTLDIENGSFTQVLDGMSFDCSWTGTIALVTADPFTVAVSTNTGEGNSFCNNAVGSTVNALVSLSDDGGTLTLDYRPGGSLQVYERLP